MAALPVKLEHDASFPEAFEFLFTPARYKVAYGGRGGAKSWAFARALLLKGTTEPLRILCGRETQESIRDSVHKLLSDQIVAMGLERFYRILVTSIVGANGTEFMFAGLRSQRVHAIKSAEGCDIVWCEEAQTISEASWRVLIPTIRKDRSEIWVSFNPDLETDATYKRFIIDPPPDAIVRKINWDQNPWFPETLRKEMERDRERDPDAYSHIWEGNCISILEGAIYAAELRRVDSEGRIRSVPYDPSRPVDCYWDLGYGDLTAIWMAQSMPFEYRLIDYIEDSAKSLEWYLREMQSRGYLFGTDWLPWDIGLHANTQLGSGRSIEELMRRAGRRVKIIPKLSVADGINAARTIFPLCWFDRERTVDGVNALRRYRYGEVEKTGSPTRVPLHDLASHGSDAFRGFAVVVKPPKPAKKEHFTDYRPAPRSPWA
jgi:phage terminase large subunit